MHDALDIAHASRHRATPLSAGRAMTRPRTRRLFRRETFDDWEGACRDGTQRA
jgi:hypothetical protein